MSTLTYLQTEMIKFFLFGVVSFFFLKGDWLHGERHGKGVFFNKSGIEQIQFWQNGTKIY